MSKKGHPRVTNIIPILCISESESLFSRDSGVAQGQMVGSFIINKYLLYLFFSQRQIGVSFIRKKVYPLHLFFLVVFGGSRGFSGLSGAAQGHMGAVLSGKIYVHGIYFSLNSRGINIPLD